MCLRRECSGIVTRIGGVVFSIREASPSERDAFELCRPGAPICLRGSDGLLVIVDAEAGGMDALGDIYLGARSELVGLVDQALEFCRLTWPGRGRPSSVGD